MTHYRHRPDGNTDEIVKALEQCGVTVWRLNDVIDLLAGYGGYTRLIEVRPEGQKKTPRKGRQLRFHEKWTGGVYWLQTVEDAIECAKSMKRYADVLRHL